MAQSRSQQISSSKKSAKRLFSPAFLIAVVCLSGVALVMTMKSTDRKPGNPALGKPAPRIDLVKLPGDFDFSVAEITLTGKITLLHFWGTWCGPCLMEYPELAEAAHVMSDQSAFQFIPVSCEDSPRETFEGLWEKTFEFFESEGIESVAFADPRGITRQSLANRLDQEALYYPTTIVIDPDGKIAGIWDGYSESGVAEMTAMVRSLSASR